MQFDSHELGNIETARKRALDRIWEHNNALHIVNDNDGFTIFLASVFVGLAMDKSPVDLQRWLAGVTKHSTTFFRLNRLQKKAYLSALLPKLNRLNLGIKPYTLKDVLLNFKCHVERQQRNMFRLNPSRKEEIGRGLLLAFMPTRGYKEVPTGSGRMDITSFEKGGVRDIIETKIWHSRQNYLDGFDELLDYMSTEKLHKGYYVVFVEKLAESGPTKGLPTRDCFCEVREGKSITVIIVDISVIAPSRKAAVRRKEIHGKQ
jgi:hypothetical protein